MKIDNTVAYKEMQKIELKLNDAINSLLILQNYYGAKNLPISEIEKTEQMIFNQRLIFDKKRFINR